MQKAIDYVPGIVLFLAGVTAGILTARKSPEQTGTAGAELGGATSTRAPLDSLPAQELKRAIVNLEHRLAVQETASARFMQLEARLDEHAARLAEVPSTSQIVAAMEQLLSKTMGSLDDRLTTQAHSIEVLKTTVSQTDSLLERVLESLDSLQTYSEASEVAEDGLFSRAV
jgi:Arc/MetJ family transcription regulator